MQFEYNFKGDSGSPVVIFENGKYFQVFLFLKINTNLKIAHYENKNVNLAESISKI